MCFTIYVAGPTFTFTWSTSRPFLFRSPNYFLSLPLFFFLFDFCGMDEDVTPRRCSLTCRAFLVISPTSDFISAWVLSGTVSSSFICSWIHYVAALAFLVGFSLPIILHVDIIGEETETLGWHFVIVAKINCLATSTTAAESSVDSNNTNNSLSGPRFAQRRSNSNGMRRRRTRRWGG